MQKLDDKLRKKEMWTRIERFMDSGAGSCALGIPTNALIVQENLRHHHQSLFVLHDWVVMPNHVHVLLTPASGITLERIVHACKSFTSKEIQRHFSLGGRLWQEDYLDRYIRDDRHFEGVSNYIRHNPVKAKLVQDASLWPYSSANRVAREAVFGK
ncbi:MAG TPA: transposase [Fimbriimonadaceae bacterium]|nr:transposase [Fimbriimonadaceae bacterium]